APAAPSSGAGSNLAGTWQGSAWELSAAKQSAESTITMQINADQTWTAQWVTNNGAPQKAAGTYTTAGNRAIFTSGPGGTRPLVHKGEDLYGILNSAVAGMDVQVDLKKAR